MKPPAQLHLSNDDAANRFIAADPLAFLIGIVLHQQIPTEKAFQSPLVLRDRLGRDLDAGEIAAMNPDDLVGAFKEPPALHRFPGSMAKRVQGVCDYLVDNYGGEVTALWKDVADADELLNRLLAIPGFGEYKARIYLGVLARRFGITPEGWEDKAPTWPSIADVASPADLIELRQRKKAWKQARS